MSSHSRREALTRIAAAAVTAPAAAQHTHQAPVQIAEGRAYKPTFFTADEFETVRVLVDLIIPRTDTPGARDARVHEIIDSGVRAANRGLWRDGLKWLDAKSGGKRFVALPAAEQVAILDTASKEKNTPGARFFKLAKDATIDGYYSTKEGLATELGWNFNTFLPEFKGCTHPEHQG